MSNLTPSTRERVYQAINNGWTTERIVNRFHISPTSVAAFRANLTMGRWTPTLPAKAVRKSARKSTTRNVTNRSQFIVPTRNLKVTTKGNLSTVTISL